MSSPQQIVAKIAQAGGSLTARDGELVLKAPAGTLDADDLALLREHKATIAKVLSETPVTIRATISEGRLSLHCPDEETARRLEAGRERIERTITSISNDQTDHFFNPADWERRQDSAGRWGWERRDAPESERWWRHSTFEELPEPIKL